VIALDAVSARTGGGWRKAPSLLTNVTLAWESGVLAILGTPADGTTALLDVLAGALRVRAGRVAVDGGDPAEGRSRIAYVPLNVALPDAMRVDEVCDLAGRIRGEPATPALSRLAPLGLELLASRRVRFLSPAEARAVALSIALTSRAPVLLVEEPLSGLDSQAPARVIAALRARATAGATVVITTASVRDATRLGDQLGVLTRGVFTHLPPSLAHGGAGNGGAKLRVVVAASTPSEVAPLIAALAEGASVSSVETAFASVAILVSGRDLLALARAVASAAARTQARVLAIESPVMPLDAIRATIAAPSLGGLPLRPSGAAPSPDVLPSRPPGVT